MTAPNKTRFAVSGSAMGTSGLTLSSAAGSLIALLDALLINGWNNKTIQSMTMEADGQVALIGYAAAHGYADQQVLRISGANQSYANTDARIIEVPTATSLRVSLAGLAGQVITGALSSRCAPAGWSKPFASPATFEAVYRPNHPDAPFLYVKNNRPAGEWWADARGYVSMPALGSGTGDFPSTAQKAVSPWGGTYNNVNTWYFIGDDRTFYLGVNDINDTHFAGFGAFDLFEPVPRSVSAGWMFQTFHSGTSRTATNPTQNTGSDYISGIAGFFYLPYTAADVANSVPASLLFSPSRGAGKSVAGAGSILAASNPLSGGCTMLPIHLYAMEAGNYYTGSMRGWLDVLEAVTLNSFGTSLLRNTGAFGDVLSCSWTGGDGINHNLFTLNDWY